MLVLRAGPIAGFIIGVILAIAGWMTAFWLGKPIRDQALASSSWPTTEGRVVRSSLEERRDEGKRQVTADIGYEYELDGKAFTGTRVWFGDDYWSSPGAEFRDAVARYPVGRPLEVHYDPAAPDESVLEPGATWSSSIAYVLGLAMIAVGGLGFMPLLMPLVLVILAIGGGVGRKRRDEWHDHDLAPPSRSDTGDDGITIG